MSRSTMWSLSLRPSYQNPVTSHCARVAIVTVEKQNVTASRAHAPCYNILWPVQLYYIISHYLVNGTILGKKTSLNTKCVFRFSLPLLHKTFLILLGRVAQSV